MRRVKSEQDREREKELSINSQSLKCWQRCLKFISRWNYFLSYLALLPTVLRRKYLISYFYNGNTFLLLPNNKQKKNEIFIKNFSQLSTSKHERAFEFIFCEWNERASKAGVEKLFSSNGIYNVWRSWFIISVMLKNESFKANSGCMNEPYCAKLLCFNLWR